MAYDRNLMSIIHNLFSDYGYGFNNYESNSKYKFIRLWKYKQGDYYEFPLYYTKPKKGILNLEFTTRVCNSYKSLAPQLNYALGYSEWGINKVIIDGTYYYVGRGCIFDKNLNPILFATKVYDTENRGEELSFYFKCWNIYIATKVMSSKGKMDKYIKDKIIPYILEFGVGQNNIIPKVIIEDIRYKFVIPKFNNKDEEKSLNQTIKDNLDMVLANIQYE